MNILAKGRPRNTALLLCLTVTVAAAAVGLGTRAAEATSAPLVSSWVTTADRSQLLTPGPRRHFQREGTLPQAVIDVDGTRSFQEMDGFGASITDSSAALLYQLPAPQRDEVMKSIFDPADGIGMSFLRQPVGGSDFIDEGHYTYNDLPAGQTDFTMARFSIAHDEAQILPLLRRARQLNPQIKVMASPWGQPAWMKANNSIIGGRLKDDPAIFRAYALYLLRFVQAYEAAGVPIYVLTIQNEPQNRTPDAYAGTDMPVAHQGAVINELGPMLRDAGLGRVRIVSYDHNWAEHPDDLADAAQLGADPEPNYPSDILRSSAARWIAGTGYHCYAGDPSAQTALHDAFPDKDIWFTECSGWHGADDPAAKVFADTLRWHAQNLGIGTTRHWAKAVVNWNLALDSRGGPVNGGCGNNPAGMCSGVVTVDGTAVSRNAEYYTIGHLSKFVRPGAVRLASNNAPDLNNVAFRNADGSTALFVASTRSGPATFAVRWNGMSVTYTLPADAIATFTWPAAPGTGHPSVDPAAWYQVSNVRSGKCLDAANWAVHPGTALQQWSCSTPAGGNQAWQFQPTADGYYRVYPRHAADLEWDVRGGSTATGDGTGVQLWNDVGGSNQRWRLVAGADGTVTFLARHSGKCLDIRHESTADGARLQQWTCTNGPAQAFRLLKTVQHS
jgi:glucosylceramidase